MLPLSFNLQLTYLRIRHKLQQTKTPFPNYNSFLAFLLHSLSPPLILTRGYKDRQAALTINSSMTNIVPFLVRLVLLPRFLITLLGPFPAMMNS